MFWLRKNGYWIFALVLLGLAALLVYMANQHQM
jgi:predicted negative regulator of RcsB-dependent stress response